MAKWIENFVKNSIKIKKTAITVGHLHKRLDLLESYWDLFRKNHHAFARMTEFDDSSYNTDDVFIATESKYANPTAWFEAEVSKK